jgi:hypothetical protein
MLTLGLIALIGCSTDKEDTSSDMEDTSMTDTEDTQDTEEPDTDEVGTARVRVVHASPDAPAVDVYINGEVSPVTDFSFLDTTGFIDLPAGDYSFAVAPTGTDFESAVPTSLDVELTDGSTYTALAHGYLDTSVESNAFAITPFASDDTAPTDGFFRVQVVHAAAASAFAKVDVWNITDMSNPTPLIPDFDYGEEVTTELPSGVAYRLGLDINADQVPDAEFDIPDTLTGLVGVYAINDADGNPSLLAHFEDGTSAQLNPSMQ